MSLTKFLNDPDNFVSREKMFFHRLVYDMQLSAARANFDLKVYEPDVDRGGFDIIFDNGELIRLIQTKTVLKTSSTKNWHPTIRFMRPAPHVMLNHAMMDFGIGGGLILIDIDDEKDDAPLSYLYTDYFLIEALRRGLLRERVAKKYQKKSLQELAQDFLAELWAGALKEKISVNKRLFLKVKTRDDLLVLMGMHHDSANSYTSLNILQCIEKNFSADKHGRPHSLVSKEAISLADINSRDIFKLLDGADLEPFKK